LASKWSIGDRLLAENEDRRIRAAIGHAAMGHDGGMRIYGPVAATDIALAAAGNRWARRLTKPLLMPLLAAQVIKSEADDESTPLVLAGLGMSWAGDVALMAEGEAAFGAGLGSFLAAHGCYLAAFAKRRRGGVRKRPWLAAAYGLAWAGLNARLWPRTGKLRIPVVIYGTALAAMAIAALDTDDPAVAAGGAAFMVSDSILALRTFDGLTGPVADALVMLTYTAAQALIADGMTG
jgi:uncharacterized membrane protein YhhN